MAREKKVVIKLTKAQAKKVWLSVDGWLDAGGCDGGLDDDEREALESLNDQISDQTRGD